MTCDSCREQILPYLYDLLEPLDKQELAAHLEQCAACQDALALARAQIGLLAEAVKAPNADIVFKAPVQTMPASAAPAEVFQPTTSRRFFLFNRWAMAATILWGIFTIGAIVGGTAWQDQRVAETQAEDRLAHARLDLEKAQGELSDKRGQTQKEIRVIQKQLDVLLDAWKKEEEVTRTKLEKDRVQLIVKGPRVAVAGARNNYDVQMSQQSITNLQQNPIFNRGQQFDKGNQLQQMMPPLNARVVNSKNNEVLYEKQLQLDVNNKANFELPPNMPIKPSDDLVIEFQTFDAEGKSVILRDYLKLVFPEYITHLATDRPMYRPGDTVSFRSLTLERFSLKPAQQDFHLRYRLLNANNEEIQNKEVAAQVVAADNKTPIQGPDGQPLRGIGTGEFSLPVDLPDGHYMLSVSEVNERFNEERRTLQVRRRQAQRANVELAFHRSAYKPGDQVKMRVRVTPLPAQAGPGRGGINLTTIVNIDGKIINAAQPQGQHFVNNEVRADFEFSLPANLSRGVGTVTISTENGVADAVRSIPIALRDILIDFYPEGGDLIAGVPNRVYFQAKTPAGKPADFEGTILDDRRQEIAQVQTLTDELEPGINQGLGSFTITPQPKRRYMLRIDAPIGMERQINLPVVKATGVVLHIPQGVVDNEINVILHSAKAQRELLIGAYCRGRMLDHKIVKAGPAQPIEVILRPQAPVGGVYRITAFEKTHDNGNVFFRPVAERLVYRKNQAHVDVAIDSVRPSYQPGEAAGLRLQARNEKHELAPSIATVAVFNAKVGKSADDRTQRSMPTHFLLTTELRNPEDLENADVLLGNHPKAAVALDLLLGAQGWRRFAEQDPILFVQKQQQKAPAFLTNSVAVPQLLEAEQKQLDKLDKGYVARAIALNKELAVREVNDHGPPDLQRGVEGLQQSVQFAQNELEMARSRVRETRALVLQFCLGGGLLTLLFIGFYMVSVGLRRLSEGGSARSWLFAGAALLGLLFIGSIVGTFALMGQPIFPELDRNNHVKLGVAVGAAAPNPPQVENKAGPQQPLPDDVGPQLDDWANLVSAPANNPLRNVPGPAARQFVEAPADVNIQLWQNNDGGVQWQKIPALDNNLRSLRQQGNYQQLLQRQLGRSVLLPAAKERSIVREYAHRREAPKDQTPDLAETVFWNPVLVMPEGTAQVNFDLSDAVTQYDVVVLTNTLDGRLGANHARIDARLPFRMTPTTPREVTETDQIAMPVDLVNSTKVDIAATLLARVKDVQFEGNSERVVALKANERRRETISIKPSIHEGEAAVLVVGKTQGFADRVERRFNVTPDGFPVTGSASGVLEKGEIEHTIDLPEQWIPGTLKVQAHLYPSALAEMQGGLNALYGAPAGPFETAASIDYANVLLLQALKQASAQGQVHALLEKRARKDVQAGMLALAASEGKDGYGWFGGSAPPDAALTAYALMMLRDAAKVVRMDAEIVERNQKFLLERRQKGALLDSSDPVAHAYVVWALTEAGIKDDLDAELAVLHQESKLRKDPYYLALAALSHLNRKKVQEGAEILRRLSALQNIDGELTGAKMGASGARGRDLDVETTALAILGWLKADRPGEFDANLKNAVKWLGQQRRGPGGYGGPQATVLALKAMLAHAQKHPRQFQGGEISLTQRGGAPPGVDIGPGRFSSPTSLTGRTQELITLTLDNAEGLAPGKNVIHLHTSAGNVLPYTLTWSYRTSVVPTGAKAPLKIAATLAPAQAMEGNTVKLRATIENQSGAEQGLSVAIIGLPAGLAIPEDGGQLDQLKKSGKISAWELQGRELVLYWGGLTAKAKNEVELDLHCRVPGFYRGPASRVYAFHDADRKYWLEPLSIRIGERK